MNLSSFLALLRDRDIQVWVDGGRLRCSAPPETLTTELREELSRRKHELVRFLHSAVSLAQQPRAIVPLQPLGTRTPVFAVAGHNGDVFCYRTLVQHLGSDQPFFGLQPPGLDGHDPPLADIQQLAVYFAAQIRAFQPHPPYVIAGYCAGGATAFELARQLRRDGADIPLVVLFGAPYATSYRVWPQMSQRFSDQVAWVIRHARALATVPSGQRRHYLAEKLRNRSAQHQSKPAAPDPVLLRRATVERATLLALRHYVPGYFDGHLALLLPCRAWSRSNDKPLRWRLRARSTEQYFGPDDCTPDNMLRESHAATFAEFFKRCAGQNPAPH